MLLSLALGAAFLAACGQSSQLIDTSDPTPPAGSSEPELAAADGTRLDAHLWDRDPARFAIYLHEYLADEDDWWPVIEGDAASEASALTLDLRGHGGSAGDSDDQERMIDDVRAAVVFARAQGYEDIALVGAGMGATLAMIAGAEEPDVFVIALSAPVEIGALEVDSAAAAALRDRLVLLASEGDLSAAHSLETLVELADLPPDRWRLFEGRLHGVDMLTTTNPGGAPAYFAEMLDVAWQR